MKLFATAIIMLLFKFCTKETAVPCETWEYKDQCVATSADVTCPDSTIVLQGTVCGTGLDEARKGDSTLLINDPGKIVVRHYIRKL